MLGVGSLPPARCCWEPEMVRLEVLLPLSPRPLPPAPPPLPPPGPKSLLPGGLCSASLRRFRMSWADEEEERAGSWAKAGGAGDSEEGRALGLAGRFLLTCAEDGEESKHST